VGGILGLAWPTEEGERNRTFFPTVAFGRNLLERWGTFTEWAAEFLPTGGDVHLLHHGSTYALAKNRHFDVHFGVGLSHAAPDFLIGGGYSVRH
jgi:hypothetical protein